MSKHTTSKTFRDNGAIGALLDEYEKAIEELKAVLQSVSDEALVTIVDKKTKNKNCRSIQTIMAHVVLCGYYYVEAIRENLGEKVNAKKKKKLKTVAEYLKALDDMFAYNVQLFADYPKIKMIEKNNRKKVKVSWNQVYDVDQMMEHAICHILRHRRQIERFLLNFEKYQNIPKP